MSLWNLRIGDHVTVGSGRVHWQITGGDEFGMFDLVSGMSGISRRAAPHELTLIYRPKTRAEGALAKVEEMLLLNSKEVRRDEKALILTFWGREYMIELKVLDVTADRQIP